MFEQEGYDLIGAALEVYNVVGVKYGTTQLDKVLVVGGHYDAVPGCPGADDDADVTVVSAAVRMEVKDREAHPKPGKWSIQQITLHLADAEIMAAGRRAEKAGQDGNDEEKEGEQHQHRLKEA